MSQQVLVPDTEPENAPGNINELETSLREAVMQPKEPEGKADEAPETVERPGYIEEKYWTGDLEESLAKQHKGFKELQRAHGQMANDLGTQRKMTDQLLALDKRATDLGHAPASSEPDVSLDGLLDNPKDVLDRYWAAKEAKLREEILAPVMQAQRSVVEQQFLEKHPNFMEVGQSPEFIDWVKASPLRVQAFQAAAQNDYVAADGLFTEYELQKAAAAPAREQDDRANLEAAKAASTESAAQAPSRSAGGKVYRRADLIRLKLEKPEVYSDPAFQAEIMQAYADGRVK